MSSDAFSKALRHYCSNFPSIADVCRKAQINRQQFDKYLTGKMLPNARTMRRICQVLDVSEEQLVDLH